ncbi:hypothetical protein EC968_009983, partial [Mortierella alpina]
DTACNSDPEVALDSANISTVDLVWRFWSMNQRLPPLERIAFTPQARLVDTFMLLSEKALVDLVWTPNQSTNPNNWTKVRRVAETLCTRNHAQNMSANTGDVIEMLFFGQQSPGNQRKTRLSSYDKRRVSLNRLMVGPWPGMSTPPPVAAPGGGAGAAPASVPIPNVFTAANLRAHSSAVVAFRQNRTRARQANQPFTATEPALPHTSPVPAGVTLPYYAPTGMVRTNGRELQVLAFDLRKPCLPPQRFHMPETERVIKDIEEVFASGPDVVNAFGSYPANHVPVVGIDPGEVVSAAGCGINIDLTSAATAANTVTVLTV